MKKEYCVISHTHWDREWYFTFEQFRYRLVKLIDNLLDIMKNQPEYIFHLDAQTIVLEDYLKIKPQNKDLLKKYITEGRIIVGPWYVQNDFYLTSGEATIRNLLIGTRLANEFGGCGTTGYIPDQFGNISQLPQIYNQFGIETCLLGRGYSFWHRDENDELKREMTPPEFYWNGKDGSKVLSVRFTTWYNNAQRFSEDPNKNLKLIDIIERNYDGTARLPYYLLMNGVDHLEAQENLLQVLPPTNELLKDGAIKQCTMQEFTDKVNDYIEKNNMKIEEHSGELRFGNDYDLLKGTLSSRVYLKCDNATSQNKLECVIEPLYTMAECMGLHNIYPKDYLEYLWKLLIENHPHDSICGCSMDAVHKNMQDRTARFNEVADELICDVLSELTSRVTRSQMNEEDYIVTVWNTMEESVSGVVTQEFNFPTDEKFDNFKMINESGEDVPFDVVSKEFYSMKTTSPINLPGELDVDSYLVKFPVKDIPAGSYCSFIIKKTSGSCEIFEKSENDALENRLFKIDISEIGQVNITDKKSGKTYKDCIRLSDTGDKGHSYVYHPVDGDAPITTDELKPEIIINNSRLEKSCTLKYTMMLPKELNLDSEKRCQETIENPVEIKLTLIENTPWVDVRCKVHNNSKNHRLRFIFDTGFKTDFTTSLIPFDTIQRDRRDVLKRIDNGTQPNSGLIYIEENNQAVGIMNKGLYEYEHLLGDRGSIALTLIRGTNSISTLRDRKQRSAMIQDGIQCLGTFELNIGLTFDAGNTEICKMVRRTKQFQNGIISHFQPFSRRKFTGGRPQVQDTDVAELFFRDSPYENITMGQSDSVFDIIGESMTISAVKLSENGEKIIIRGYNTTDDIVDYAVRINAKKAEKLTMDESAVLYDIKIEDGQTQTIMVKPREIVTLGFTI